MDYILFFFRFFGKGLKDKGNDFVVKKKLIVEIKSFLVKFFISVR